MTVRQPQDNRRDPRLDDNDPVWDLLAHAPLPEPHPWFTARTLARCREEISRQASPWFSLGRIWRWALGGGLSVCLAFTLMMRQTQTPAVSNPPDDQKNVQEAFEIVASVDSGVGSDTDSSTSTTSSSWQDSSSL